MCTCRCKFFGTFNVVFLLLLCWALNEHGKREHWQLGIVLRITSTCTPQFHIDSTHLLYMDRVPPMLSTRPGQTHHNCLCERPKTSYQNGEFRCPWLNIAKLFVHFFNPPGWMVSRMPGARIAAGDSLASPGFASPSPQRWLVN
jgi:hypothetical protein